MPACQGSFAVVETPCNFICAMLSVQDKCMLEGVSDGELPPGVRPAGFKPLGTCFNNTDCSSGFDCITTDKTICSCEPATGTDSCRLLGSCVMQPCKACEVCVQAMQLFPEIVKGVTRADDVAVQFRSFCAGTGHDPLACAATAAAISSSFAGHVGRRLGAICRSLAECSDRVPADCNITAVQGGTPQRPNLCTVEGVAGGKDPDILLPAPTGSCMVDANCSTPGTFCSRTSTHRACTCTTGTGDVMCEVRGMCQPTPCKVCSDCVAELQSYVAATTDNRTAVASTFVEVCISNNSATACASTAASIASSNKGNLGRRAGALCSMLGECFVVLGCFQDPADARCNKAGRQVKQSGQA